MEMVLTDQTLYQQCKLVRLKVITSRNAYISRAGITSAYARFQKVQL